MPDMWVADAVYSPLWTPLLKAAKAKGAAVMTGRELAIYQAADAFELFTGLKPSAIEMGIAFDAVMAKRYAERTRLAPSGLQKTAHKDARTTHEQKGDRMRPGTLRRALLATV